MKISLKPAVEIYNFIYRCALAESNERRIVAILKYWAKI